MFIFDCYCSSDISIDDWKNISEIIALWGGIIISSWIFYSWKFTPIILLNISYVWIDQENGLLNLKLRIQNKSRVKARKREVFLQILQYNLNERMTLSEWVPFIEKDIHEAEKPIPWTKPVNIFEPTEAIYPGEITHVNYMCHCPKGKLVHIGLQFRSEGMFVGIFEKDRESWTTTAIIGNPNSSPNN